MLTDKYGMSFYKLCEPRFIPSRETYKTVNRYNPLSGHRWTEQVPKKDIEQIQYIIEKEYQNWLCTRQVRNKYHPLNFMPRTPKETRKIQAQIDGVNNWWNIK